MIVAAWEDGCSVGGTRDDPGTRDADTVPALADLDLETESQLFVLSIILTYKIMEEKKEINYDELGLLLCEYVKAMGEAKESKKAVVDYLVNNDAFDCLADIVSDFALLLKNP